MATPGELGPFADRRLRFAAALGDALAIIPGAQEARRNGDVNYEFRQSSDFFFLTGFDEPDAVAVVNPAHTKERYVLFVRPRDRDLEIWTGHRAGVEGAVATYGADAAYPIDKLDDKLREYLVDRPVVYYRLGQGAFDGRVTRLVVAQGRDVPAVVETFEDDDGALQARVAAELVDLLGLKPSRTAGSFTGGGPMTVNVSFAPAPAPVEIIDVTPRK